MNVTNNQNNFNGTTNFNGPIQFAGGDIINETCNSKQHMPQYTPEPKWRSPVTLAVLSWISVIVGILSLFSSVKIITNTFGSLKRNAQKVWNFSVQIYLVLFLVFIFLFVLSISLLQIAKKQIRVPFILNYAVNGYDKRITLEKIHISNCPQCGGKMRYYNRPVEWVNKYYSDGQTKREVSKRIPVFECKRNRDHWYEVDPAGDRVN